MSYASTGIMNPEYLPEQAALRRLYFNSMAQNTIADAVSSPRNNYLKTAHRLEGHKKLYDSSRLDPNASIERILNYNPNKVLKKDNLKP